jgi:hypothetical protein
MPNSVDEVKFINDCGLLKPALTGSGVACRKRAMVGSRAGGAGDGGDEFSLGGVGVVKLRSKGLRGTGRIRGGPSSAIVCLFFRNLEFLYNWDPCLWPQSKT